MTDTLAERIVEDIIIFYLVFSKILQFFGWVSILGPIGITPEVVDFIDIVISMTGLGYVLYRASLTDIFFGERNKTLDFTLIMTYFMFIMNKFVEFSNVIIHNICNLACTPLDAQNHPLLNFFILIYNNNNNLVTLGFYIGGISLLLLSVYITKNVKVKEPSVLNALHGENMGIYTKLVTTFFVLVTFYLIFFNIVMEWFARVLDAPMIMIAIFFYIFKVHEIGLAAESEKVLHKVSDIVEDSIEKFVGLFKDKRTIFLGISALLVIHLANDVTSLVIPYALANGSQYTDDLGAGHTTIPSLFMADKRILNNPGLETLALAGYALNTIAIIFLMIFPAYMWYVMYKSQGEDKVSAESFPNIFLAIFYCSFVFFLFFPIFKITSIGPGDTTVKNLVGVDIQTSSLLTSGNNLLVFFVISIIVFIIAYFVLKSKFVKDLAIFITGIIDIGFFGLYVFNYFLSFFLYYIDFLKNLISMSDYFIAFYIFVFLVVTTVFYIGGYLSFVYSSFR